MTKFKAKLGMTLIELLVVITIIGLMVGVAFPIFSYYQKRGAVVSDAENMVQVLNYARALENNPDYQTRSDENSQTVVKLVNTDGVYKAQIYSTVDSSKIIDEFQFMTSVKVYLNGTETSPDGLEIKIDGKTPKEQLGCSIGVCTNYIKIRFYKGNSSSIYKEVELLNTREATDQLFSIKVK
ncbi:MAG: type II secretion system protein [Patescibacteria group bacterium]|jgi:prepilin-type N-terminal cleavage/methylation domain-containing protein